MPRAAKWLFFLNAKSCPALTSDSFLMPVTFCWISSMQGVGAVGWMGDGWLALLCQWTKECATSSTRYTKKKPHMSRNSAQGTAGPKSGRLPKWTCSSHSSRRSGSRCMNTVASSTPPAKHNSLEKMNCARPPCRPCTTCLSHLNMRAIKN